MVQVSIKEALRLGIAAHRNGNAAEAQSMYLAILDLDPDNSDANHNLGVLGVELNQIEKALPFFERAITSNNQVKQYWFSYIEALIKLNRDTEADIAIQKARKFFGPDSRLNSYKNTKNPESKVTKKNRSLNASIRNAKKFLKQKKYEEAQQICETVLNVFPGNVDAKKILQLINRNTSDLTSSVGVNIPSNAINALIADYQKGSFEEVITAGATLVYQYPTSVELLNIVAAAQSSSGKLQEAVGFYKKAISISPEQPHLFNNLGNALRRLKSFEEAIQNLKHAIEIHPDYFDAHINLGLTYKDLNQTDLALKHFVRARNIRPEDRQPNLMIVNTISNSISFKGSQDVLDALTEITKDHSLWKSVELSNVLTAYFKREIKFKDFDFYEYERSHLFERTVKLISKSELLQQFIKFCVIPDIEVEKLFRAMRKEILLKLSKVSVLNIIGFQNALALQCDVNEYIYRISDEEQIYLEEIQTVIERKLESNEQPTSDEILCFASYLPLRRLLNLKNLTVNSEIKELYIRQVEDFKKELELKASIKHAVFGNGVTKEVRAQYEQNPYPRWITASISNNSIDIRQLASSIPLRLSSSALTSSKSLRVLIAGCGTGLQAIEAATRFKNASVDAIDISTSSLAYAKRKADELNITNINFQHLDILQIDQLGEKYDIIESVGVLHHMEDPVSGWRALTKCMHSGSLMKVGLYSAKARETINFIRNDVSKRKLELTVDEIIDYRHWLLSQSDLDYAKVLKFLDFYSLSEFRDLLFHVQEHQFSIPELKQIISDLGLTFCGFELPENVQIAFGLRSTKHDPFSLDMWGELEEANPELFAGMYQFWVQKYK